MYKRKRSIQQIIFVFHYVDNINIVLVTKEETTMQSYYIIHDTYAVCSINPLPIATVPGGEICSIVHRLKLRSFAVFFF